MHARQIQVLQLPTVRSLQTPQAVRKGQWLT